jgi:tetratricopeptide (TPR) repeat protein
MRDRPGSPEEAAAALLAWHKTGLSALKRHVATGDAAQLQQADLFLRKAAVQAAESDDPNLGAHLRNLALTDMCHYELTGEPARLDEAIELHRRTLAMTPGGHPFRGPFLHSLGSALMRRYHRTGHVRDLEEAVAYHRGAVASTPDTDPERPTVMSHLANALTERHGHTQNAEDLIKSVTLHSQALDRTPAGHPDRVGLLSNLGVSLVRLHLATGDLRALDDAIGPLRATLRERPHGDPNRPVSSRTLATALRIRYDLARAPEDLDEAIVHLRSAVKDSPVSAPSYLDWLFDLADAHLDRGLEIGGVDHADSALAVLRYALDHCPACHPDHGHRNHAVVLAKLGLAHRTRHGMTGDPEDLDQAIALLRRARAAGLSPVNLRPATVALADMLHARHVGSGNQADLDEAVRLHRDALEHAGGIGDRSAAELTGLAQILLGRSEDTGDLTDLDEGIGLLRRAAEQAGADDPNRSAALHTYAQALMVRHGRMGTVADIDEAIGVYRNLLAPGPRFRQPDRPVHGSLAQALHRRHEYSGDIADLDEAVGLYRHGLALTPGGHPDEALLLNSLGTTLRTRYGRLREPQDLDEAISLLRRCVASYFRRPGDPAQVRALLALAESLSARFVRTQDQSMLQEALGVARQAAAFDLAPVRERLAARGVLGHLHATANDWPMAHRVLGEAVALLPILAPRALTRTEQQYVLAPRAGLAAGATACALQAGAEECALELFEQGRGVLLSRTLGLRGGLDALRRLAPEVADRFVTLQDELDARDGTAPGREAGPAAGPYDPDAAETHRAKAAEFEELLGRIRAVPGLERFLLPVPAPELLRQADEGPIVLINIDHYRCDALILRAGRLTVLPLPDVNPASVTESSGRFLAAVAAASDPGLPLRARWQAQRTVTEVLAWLWDRITGPVLDHLGFTAPPPAGSPWPRIWWCAQGPLALLPLHAAGHHGGTDGAGGDGRAVLERVISSYTPTIGALRHARRPASDRTVRAAAGTRRSVTVTVTRSPGGHPALSGAENEAGHVRACFPGTVVLTDEEATTDNVLEHLNGAAHAHFACHAVADPDNPSASRLLTYDEAERPLTVAALTRLNLESAELVYLSACATTTTTPELADEALHITGACQLAGFRHVIGTLWRVQDSVAGLVAEKFYAALATPEHGGSPAGALHQSPAVALHQAVRDLRQAYPRTPTMWAAHLHVGA